MNGIYVFKASDLPSLSLATEHLLSKESRINAPVDTWHMGHCELFPLHLLRLCICIHCHSLVAERSHISMQHLTRVQRFADRTLVLAGLVLASHDGHRCRSCTAHRHFI